jgi:hypothetical protein
MLIEDNISNKHGFWLSDCPNWYRQTFPMHKYYSISIEVRLWDMYIDNVFADLIFQLHIHKPATFNWIVYAKPAKCAVMFLCYVIFLRFFFIGFWNCSDNDVMFFVFHLVILVWNTFIIGYICSWLCS